MALNMGYRCLNASKRSIMSSMRHSVASRSTVCAFHTTPARAVIYANANASVFNKAISNKDRIAVVDFHADWCGPCHQLAPVVEKLTNEPNKAGSTGLPFDLVKVDIDSDDGQILGAKYQIRALPTVIAFRDGAPISQFVGARNEAEVEMFLGSL